MTDLKEQYKNAVVGANNSRKTKEHSSFVLKSIELTNQIYSGLLNDHAENFPANYNHNFNIEIAKNNLSLLLEHVPSLSVITAENKTMHVFDKHEVSDILDLNGKNFLKIYPSEALTKYDFKRIQNKLPGNESGEYKSLVFMQKNLADLGIHSVISDYIENDFLKCKLAVPMTAENIAAIENALKNKNVLVGASIEKEINSRNNERMVVDLGAVTKLKTLEDAERYIPKSAATGEPLNAEFALKVLNIASNNNAEHLKNNNNTYFRGQGELLKNKLAEYNKLLDQSRPR